MSHHRDPVTAPGAPDAVGPYSHAVRSGGLLYCSGQIAARPRDRQARRGLGRRPDAPLPGEPAASSARPPAPSLRDAVRIGIYVTDMGTFPAGQRGLRQRSSPRTRRRAARSASRRCRSGRAVEIDAIVALPELAAPAMATGPPARTVTAEDVARARQAIADVAKRTPVLPSLTLTQRPGGEVVLKAENLQRTGSFKIRGALNKLAALGEACAQRGHRGQRRQPRVGAGAGGAGARRAVRGLHAGGGAAVEGRGLQATSAPSCTAAARRSRSAWRRPRRARARPAWPSCTPSTTPTSSPARARSASSCSTTSPTWRRSSCRSAAAGWPAASRSR